MRQQGPSQMKKNKQTIIATCMTVTT